MKLARALVVVALGSIALVPVTPLGQAGAAGKPTGATTTDARGDVAYRTYEDGDIEVGNGTAKTRKMGDIASVNVKHTKTQVRVLISYVDLARVGTDHLHVVQIQTPKKYYTVYVGASTGSWKGRVKVYNPNAAEVKKCGVTWKLDYAKNTALVVVPRKCLGTPSWIRAGAGMSNTYGNKRYADDGLTAAVPNGGLVLGPKLYR